MTYGKDGHYGRSGPKISYKTYEEAQEAVDRRLKVGVRHDGTPWRKLKVYQCRQCLLFHFTSTNLPRSENFMKGGWARVYGDIDLELGTRVACHLRAENEKRRVSGLEALRRRYHQNGIYTI